jgi:hypothetical protein
MMKARIGFGISIFASAFLTPSMTLITCTSFAVVHGTYEEYLFSIASQPPTVLYQLWSLSHCTCRLLHTVTLAVTLRAHMLRFPSLL